jgi:NTP pyrophosphatase (non-canonical NTP hydrolase)
MSKTKPSEVSTDMNMMHAHYGVHEAMKSLSNEHLREFLKFRFRFLLEEVNEGMDAIENELPEEIVDSLIDLVVVAVGTLDLFNVDFNKAWQEVLKANMNKRVGVKASRPNPWGLPDLVKPDGWQGPDHTDNHGLMKRAFMS